MQKSKIEWTDNSWNPMRGCRRVSKGCVNCYAEKMANRFTKPGQPFEGVVNNGRWTGKGVFMASKLHEPLKMKAPQRIFVNSMSDLFFEDFEFEQIAAVFGVMCAAPWHTFQILTKRPERALEFYKMLNDLMCAGELNEIELCWEFARSQPEHKIKQPHTRFVHSFGENIWLGVSVEDQDAANRIEPLLECPASKRFLSCEPLLGPVDLTNVLAGDGTTFNALKGCEDTHGLPRLDWVIAGGESGGGARPMDESWARKIMEDCVDSDVSFFMKQMGSVGYKGKGADCIPEDLDIKQFPS